MKRSRFTEEQILLVRHDDRSSKKSFGDWAARYVAAFEAEHRLTPVLRLAAILERRFSDPLDLRQLAREVGGQPRALDRAFRDTFSMSMHEYLTRTRVANAIPTLREEGTKVDAVAGSSAIEARRPSTGRFGASPA